MAESLQSTKRRIKGVQNINQITRAMELVAATKMRKSQEIALNSRPYAFAALDLLATLSRLVASEETILSEIEELKILDTRKVERSLIVLVTSDKALPDHSTARLSENLRNS